jgi:hypothetical protein
MESIGWTVIDLLFDLPRLLVRHLGKRVRQLLGVTWGSRARREEHHACNGE